MTVEWQLMAVGPLYFNKCDSWQSVVIFSVTVDIAIHWAFSICWARSIQVKAGKKRLGQVKPDTLHLGELVENEYSVIGNHPKSRPQFQNCYFQNFVGSSFDPGHECAIYLVRYRNRASQLTTKTQVGTDQVTWKKFRGSSSLVKLISSHSESK